MSLHSIPIEFPTLNVVNTSRETEELEEENKVVDELDEGDEKTKEKA